MPIPVTVTLDGRLVPVRVLGALEGHGELEQPARLSMERLLSDAADLERRCPAALLAPPPGSEEGATELYVSHHLEVVALPVGLTDGGIEAFVQAMNVRSIWAAPDDDGELLHIDYTIDARRTQYVLSVALDRDGVVRSVRMES